MEKISKAQIKLVRSLQMKKFRDETGLFVAEGEKCVEELRKGFEVVYNIKPLPNPLLERGDIDADRKQNADADRVLLASPKEIEQMSGLRTPQGIVGVFKKRPIEDWRLKIEDIILVLDGIQDPGNLGTIIRTCDWFGVHEIVCSLDTADCYNPKVVQATMGALARVNLCYLNLPHWLEGIRNQESGIRIYGTLLEGEDMYEVMERQKTDSINEQKEDTASLKVERQKTCIIMGNEGNGISAEVRKLITHPIRIPSYPQNGASEVVESLNVSIATAIVLAEFRRAQVH